MKIIHYSRVLTSRVDVVKAVRGKKMTRGVHMKDTKSWPEQEDRDPEMHTKRLRGLPSQGSPGSVANELLWAGVSRRSG